MNSPLNNRIRGILEKNLSSFHTPGHKGVGTFDLAWDLTELEGLESLYESKGGIWESEQEFSRIFGHRTVLSAGGSTLCIQGMMTMAVPVGGEIIINRGAHLSAINAMALLDIAPSWIEQQAAIGGKLMLPPTPAQIKKAILNCPEAKAVFITSPDYYGQNADIESIAKICRTHGKLLIVDAAHGAHYKFFKKSLYPLDLGADLCCASLHKTLPAMTGAAILSMTDDFSSEAAKKSMSIFGSTSPSYSILLSADKLLPRLWEKGRAELENLAHMVEKTKSIMLSRGLGFLGGNVDPTRITVDFGEMGYEPKEFAGLLKAWKIQPEYMDDSYCVLIPTINNTAEDWERLNVFLERVPINEPIIAVAFKYPRLEAAVSIRKAFFSQSRKVPINKAVGEIAASVFAPCPPGIPLVIPGERLNQRAIESLKKHGVLEIDVV